HYAIWLEEQGVADWPRYFQEYPAVEGAPRRRHVWDLPPELHYTTWTAERTIANIERSVEEEKPFFIWASFHDPHPPYLVPEPWASMYDPADMEPGTLRGDEHEAMPPHFALTQQETADFSGYNETGLGAHGLHSHLADAELSRQDMAVYYGMTSFLDQQIGRILETLDWLKIADETLIVFTTDHGHFLGQHGLWHKGPFHYEDLLRLPFIVRWPGHVSAGERSEALQSLVDLAPTFLAAAGLPVPGRMQGVDQLPVWRGEAEKARDEVIVEFHHEPTTVHLRTYIDERYKLTIYRDQPYGEIFDLLEDPGEHRNLWNEPDCAALKGHLFARLANAEMKREPMSMPRLGGS
ncbi:MAG: DUF4976 domain-containing protein, partial [Hyphomicrobiales bacterium]